MGTKQRPQYKENPNPVHAYRLRMHIHDAPGPLRVTVSATQHDVVTPECLPPPNANPGGHLSPIPTNDIPFQLERASEAEYTGVFYTDGIIDEDYHGRGICRWELIQVQVQLKASGTEGETRFIVSLDKNELSGGGPKTVYYWKGGYPRSFMDDFPDYGVTSVEDVREGLRGDLFSVTITAESPRQ
ncbi:hypothetical protein [Pseudoxanthomonas japonensis]|uniref:hypothetical protein n=1 Tax=Pseudoxanthomonas japonensis TaxID=69284 RepID=UPI001391B326|nr:hypothetical protein [Pseudoxanthomonas japonensis]